MTPVFGALLAVLAAAAVIAAHMLSRGRAARLDVGTLRFARRRTTRERRLGPVRDRLLLGLRLLLVAATLAWWYALRDPGVLSATKGPTAAAVSTLAEQALGDAATSDVGSIPSPAFASLQVQGAPEELTIVPTVADSTTIAPTNRPTRWALAPAPATAVTVAVVHAAARTTDARLLTHAFDVLPESQGIELVAACAPNTCPATVDEVDVLFWLGDDAPPGTAERRVVTDASLAATTPALARVGLHRWRWGGRFHPEHDERVLGAGFPETLASLTLQVHRAAGASIVTQAGGAPVRPEILALLMTALFLLERWRSGRTRHASVA